MGQRNVNEVTESEFLTLLETDVFTYLNMGGSSISLIYRNPPENLQIGNLQSTLIKKIEITKVKNSNSYLLTLIDTNGGIRHMVQDVPKSSLRETLWIVSQVVGIIPEIEPK